MSMHLFDESRTRMAPSPINNSLTNGHESDSDNASPSAVIQDLEGELKREKDGLAKAKKENRILSSLLQQAQDDGALLEHKYDNVTKALHKATNKINELEALCDKREGEIAELKASLEAASDLEGRLKGRLESSEKKCLQSHIEKSLSEDKVTQLEQEVRKLEENALNDQELLVELEHLRTLNLDLRRELVAARETGHRSLAGMGDAEDSPDRMIYDSFDHRTGGLNLHQELIMLGSPLSATFSRSVQFPSREDIREEHVLEDHSAYQPMSHASVQTDQAPPKSFLVASTQTNPETGSNLGNGTAAALQPYYVPYQSPQQMFRGSSELNHDSPSTYRVSWWIWVLAVLGLIFAIVNNGGRINITPIVDSCRNGMKFHHNRGIPPH